jgi:hypothetical protein
MAKFSAKAVAAMKEVFNKAQYIKREWKTDESCTMTLSEYAELIDPILAHAVGNPEIIAKERKDGGIFLKMSIQLEGASMVEYDLSYESDFEEGDIINLSTLTFCIEKCLDKSHGYATGEIVEE